MDGSAQLQLRPRIEHLEPRFLLVVGAFDIPVALEAGSGYDGVARINNATGAMLSTARHALTAAHVASGPADTEFVVLGPGEESVKINTPASEYETFPIYPTPQDYDIAVMTFAELGPLNAERWDIYTGSDEVGKLARVVGYGQTGTGTTGDATDIGTGTNYEVTRFTITGNPTGGIFMPRLSTELPPAQPAVPYDTSAATLATALDALPGVDDVQVRLVGDTDFDGTVDNLAHPYAGSFEALIRQTDAADHSLPDLIATHNFTGGSDPNIVVETLLQGGSPRAKRTALNWVGDAVMNHDTDPFNSRLLADFDDGTAASNTLNDGLGQGANEGLAASGDSGSPVFIDGKIAGVHEGRRGNGLDGEGSSTDFGERDSWVRVSLFQDFIDGILDDPFDLVLNMENQPWGGDGISDTIEVSRFLDALQIRIDGVLYYEESLGQIESVTIQGSSDDDTIIVSALGDGIPVSVSGRGGSDTIRLDGLSDATAALFGHGGADTIVIGGGDFASNIVGNVIVFGGDSNSDTLVLDDQQGSGDHTYTLDSHTFTMSSYPNSVSNLASDLENIHLFANHDYNEINVLRTPTGTSLSVSANSGDDTIRFGDGDIGTNIRGNVEVHGGFGHDVLVLHDEDNDTSNGIHTLNESTYDNANYAGTLTFHFMQDVRLRTGDNSQTVDILNASEDVAHLLVDTDGGDDRVNVHLVPSNTTVGIRTRGGNDTIDLSPLGFDLDAVAGHVLVDAGTGVDDVLRLHDDNDDGNDTYTISATSVSRPGFHAAYARVESLRLDANRGANTININSLGAATELAVNAGDGSDAIHLAPATRELADIKGVVFVNGASGEDDLVLHDENNPSLAAMLTVEHNRIARAGFEMFYANFRQLAVRLGGPADVVDIESTAFGTHLMVHTGAGPDAISANVPSAAQLTLDGGADDDEVTLTGTPVSDELSVSAGYGSADVNLVSFEQAEVDLLGGADTLRYEGVAGMDEQVEVHASTTSSAGALRAVGLLDLLFADTEFIDLLANQGEADAAAFIGTEHADELNVDLAAAGTAADPILQLLDANNAAILLTLLDYGGFGTLALQGNDGTDEFNVYVAPAGPGTGRDLSIDGGVPSGNGPGKDELKVFFKTPPKPVIVHDKDNKNNLGSLTIEYELEEFFIAYSDIEKAVNKANAAG